MEGSEPQGGKERGEGDPREPGLVEGREREDEEGSAQGGGGPGPEGVEDGHQDRTGFLTAEGAEGTEKGGGKVGKWEG